MKKLFFYMTMVAAMAFVVVSCSKDDDEDNSKEAFVNKLTQNGTTCTWEGSERTLSRSWGSWSNDGEKYAVMRFDRASTTATQGTGWVLYFENSYKEVYKDGSEFTWSIVGDELKITYRHSGWAPVHAEYNTQELIINGNRFDGTWFESSDKKFEFKYNKSTFNTWNKYINQ
jgi:hypothetical protein